MYGEKKFINIVDYVNEGDLMVVNDARVEPARLLGRKDTGAKVELFLLEKIDNATYKVLAKPSKRLKEGSTVVFLDHDGKEAVTATVLENADFGKLVRFHADGDLDEALKKIGQVPLPPYIKRAPEKLDAQRYQTVYAKNGGATASPTAGLHFTDEIFSRLKKKGVAIAPVTLQVSYGTFAPVLEDEIEKHVMHKEHFQISQESADLVRETKRKGNKVIAVGTTATRVLETCGIGDGREGWTDIFIHPGYHFKVVDMLLTNFHVPQSTLLMLVSAFADRELIFEAYRQAVDARFRFFSYGDCMLIV